MTSGLDEIEFLARSEHRVGVLDALAERPSDRHDLRAARRSATGLRRRGSVPDEVL
jgi:hypothetical protein